MGAIPYMAILAELTSDDVLDTAYGWLCRRRQNYPADADVWSFRQTWAQEKDKLKAMLAAGRFRFGLLTRIMLKDGEEIDLWSACDALVLKALAIVLARRTDSQEDRVRSATFQSVCSDSSVLSQKFVR